MSDAENENAPLDAPATTEEPAAPKQRSPLNEALHRTVSEPLAGKALSISARATGGVGGAALAGALASGGAKSGIAGAIGFHLAGKAAEKKVLKTAEGMKEKKEAAEAAREAAQKPQQLELLTEEPVDAPEHDMGGAPKTLRQAFREKITEPAYARAVGLSATITTGAAGAAIAGTATGGDWKGGIAGALGGALAGRAAEKRTRDFSETYHEIVQERAEETAAREAEEAERAAYEAEHFEELYPNFSKKASWWDRARGKDVNVAALTEAERDYYFRIQPMREIIPGVGWIQDRWHGAGNRIKNRMTDTTALTAAKVMGGTSVAAATSLLTDAPSISAAAGLGGAVAANKAKDFAVNRYRRRQAERAEGKEPAGGFVAREEARRDTKKERSGQER